MNFNTSGTTFTTMTTLDGQDDTSIGGYSIATNASSHLTSTNASSRRSFSMQSITLSAESEGSEIHRIYNYALGDFEHFTHSKEATSEEICFEFCRKLRILPTTRLLFGLRVYEFDNEWAMPGELLRPKTLYCFRMRFKVPSLDTQLQVLDSHAYDYLYRQMRHDMIREKIPEIRYPNKKDHVVGLAVVDMYIDEKEGNEPDAPKRIIKNYKRYLPKRLLNAHTLWAKKEIRKSYSQLRCKTIDSAFLKYNYVHQISELAENYLMERYTAVVNYIPGDDQSPNHTEANVSVAMENSCNDAANAVGMGIHVYVKLHLNDTVEPGLKVARMAAEDNLKWTLVAKLTNIYSLCAEGAQVALLEISDLSSEAYRMQFENEIELKSFTSFLAGYIRLTVKWMLDLCGQHITPSLKELKALRVHGPVGGNFSYAKIREKRDECGRYLIRQCEREYDIYYIDMNTRNTGSQVKSCKTETYKIKREIIKTQPDYKSKWILYLNNNMLTFDELSDLVKAIPADSDMRTRIPPSEYDKPPLLLICLPKKQQSQEIELELNESQLQRKRVQIFDPKIDLQWYKKSISLCNEGKMLRIRADWIQKQGSYKDVSVTLKVLKFDNDFKDFMKLANTWSKIYSPQFIKLYGLTLSTPHTMIMEYAPFGALNQFLSLLGQNATVRLLLDVVQNLLRGMIYLHELNMVHGNIRCSNLYVTKFDPKGSIIVSKISDPGLARSYTQQDLPWIPFEYHNNLNAAREDRTADLWAFATTVWEIFARGQTLDRYTSETLWQQYNKYGGILQTPSEDCPEDMYLLMLDGWSQDPGCRFNQTEIFRRLNDLKKSNYATISPSGPPVSVASLLEKLTVNHSNDHFEEFNGYNDDDSIASSTACDTTALNNRNYLHSTPFVVTVPFGKLVCKKIIGQGHYGKVWEGEIQYSGARRNREKVAVKVLKNFRNKQFTKDFEREISIMKELNHPNIVKIIQWILNPIYIIMEYLECGSFLDYLTTNPDLTNDQLLRFALDIAKGMEYLGSKSIVHRDLAARNILVDGNHVKISDFGLAQICGSDGYYRVQSNRDIPYKWYSPDALRSEKYSFYSDVWSYGVTLFEMFSQGAEPNLDKNAEISQTEYLNRLENGVRLPKPDGCPKIVYERLMLRCWDKIPKSRPTFTQLVDEIKSIIKIINDDTN